MVRGVDYLEDHCKVPAARPYFDLMETEFLRLPTPVAHRTAMRDSAYHRHRDPDKFYFVVNFMITGEPSFNVVAYFCRPKADMETGARATEGFERVLAEFVAGDDAHRNDRFKLIPRVVEGGYVVSKAVGSRPAVIGRKLDQHYYESKGEYLEVTIDVGSSKVGTTVFKFVKGYAKSLVIDLCFVLEAGTKAELRGAERLLGGCRMSHIDTDRADAVPLS